MAFPHLLHGADYNPEQWLDAAGILDEDIRLMKLAHVNTVSIGIFSWATLEPQEGHYRFEWMDDVVDRLFKNGIRFNLATPSGGKPRWMASKYPEIRRCLPNGEREPQQARHNHCFTSPVYREKVQAINSQLASRYANHPGLQLWHISNEFNGECHCALCKSAFREWLKNRYGSLDVINKVWWTNFWSHTYTAWDQIDFIDPVCHGLVIDWKRFVTDQTVDFMKSEIVPLRAANPKIPVTTNFMGTFEQLNYWKFVPHLDIASWDSYPEWHRTDDAQLAVGTAFTSDIYRTFKGGQPWLLMESTPSAVNWTDISRVKQPGMHRLSSLQTIAHGSDSVLYFQWRKGRGGWEKFHGAVIDHDGGSTSRVFQEVAALGEEMEKLIDVAGATTKADVAIIFDWENRWAINSSRFYQNERQSYQETCRGFYQPLWQRGVAVDIPDMEQSFDKYKLLIAPMLYMLRPGVAERIEAFVKNGGTLVTTYYSGYVDETDLCFQGGFPGPLRKILGLRVEETDVPMEAHGQTVHARKNNTLGLKGRYKSQDYCDIIHLEGAQTLATYEKEFYGGTPAATVNYFGKGTAIYIGSRNEQIFQNDLIRSLAKQLNLSRAIDAKLPLGVTAQCREKDGLRHIFIMNFNNKPVKVMIGHNAVITLSARGCEILRENAGEPKPARRIKPPRAR